MHCMFVTHVGEEVGTRWRGKELVTTAQKEMPHSWVNTGEILNLDRDYQVRDNSADFKDC